MQDTESMVKRFFIPLAIFSLLFGFYQYYKGDDFVNVTAGLFMFAALIIGPMFFLFTKNIVVEGVILEIKEKTILDHISTGRRTEIIRIRTTTGEEMEFYVNKWLFDEEMSEGGKIEITYKDLLWTKSVIDVKVGG